MSSADRDSIDETLARFLDGEPEPNDGALLAEAMRSDERFAREVARLLEVDDLIRQGAEPDERAFLEALKLRLSTEHGGGAFLQELERRVRRGTSVPRRPWLAWTLAAAVVVAIALIVLFW